MCGDECKTITLNVIIQENGIIRNTKGRFLGRLDREIEFDSEHLKSEKKKPYRFKIHKRL